MDTSRYSAIKGFKARKSMQFFSWANVLLFIACVIFLAYLLFPGMQLIQTLVSEDYLSEVDYRYSVLMLKENKIVTLSSKIIRNQPELAIQQLNDLLLHKAHDTSSANLWLSYVVIRTLALTPETRQQVREQGLEAMKDFFSFYSTNQQLNSGQLKILARDALEINSAKWALVFFDRIVKNFPEQSMTFYGEAAKTSTWVHQCEKSADYAFKAKDKANTIEDKRYFYFLAIQSLFQCGQYDLAMTLAEKNIDGLTRDITTYQLLTEDALKAGKPELANQYLMKLLVLQGFEENKVRE